MVFSESNGSELDEGGRLKVPWMVAAEANHAKILSDHRAHRKNRDNFVPGILPFQNCWLSAKSKTNLPLYLPRHRWKV